MMCPFEAICDGTSFPENVPNVVGSDRPEIEHNLKHLSETHFIGAYPILSV